MPRTTALAALAAFAAIASFAPRADAAPPRKASAPAAAERAGADLLPPAHALRLSRAAVRPVAPAKATPAKAVTVEDVGDVDSFGRPVRWLGVTNAFVTLAPTCDAEAPACQPLAPSPATTRFDFTDTVRIKLPGKATHSLLCYWFSPVLMVTYANETTAPVVARLRYNPTLRVSNPVLDDPALIDPATGLPFGGSLRTSMTASESFELPLDPGVSITERTRDSAVCIGGFLSRRTLVDQFGLTDAQATEFFRKPTTVSLDVQGSAQHVQYASLIFGLRIMGD